MGRQLGVGFHIDFRYMRQYESTRTFDIYSFYRRTVQPNLRPINSFEGYSVVLVIHSLDGRDLEIAPTTV